LRSSKSFILPCSRQIIVKGISCDFELRALRPDLNSEKFNLYAHSQHNHHLESERKHIVVLSLLINKKITVKRLPRRAKTELMPDGNPPTIYRTLDNIEWAFLQTFPDYAKMHEFGIINHTTSKKNVEKRLNFRYYCYNRPKHDRCKFMLLAVKTTKQRYHVYSYGKHNHPVRNPKSKLNFTSYSKFPRCWYWYFRLYTKNNSLFTIMLMPTSYIANIFLFFN
jgi:hypothetical protein